MAKSTGEIFELYNNYGSINSDSFKQGEETIPFEITRDMIVEKDGSECIKYTNEVTFDLKRTDNVRDRQIKEAVNVEFTGGEWLFKKRAQEKSYEEDVVALFEKYCFANPHPDNLPALRRYLDEIGFRPRMLEYLMAQGIFLKRDVCKPLFDILSSMSGGMLGDMSESMLGSMLDNLQFDPWWIIVIGKIDQRFSALVVKWVVALELAYKDFISLTLTRADSDISYELCDYWQNKNNKGKKQFERARAKRRFRQYSELFDYVSQPEQVPIEDLLEQLDLSELPEFLKKLKEIAAQHNLNSPDLDAMYTSASMITDLSVLRNAAAHGKSLIIGFMDPDFNANWDLDIDNPESRGKVENWELYALMHNFWSERLPDADKKTLNRIISTVFGNPYRRSWSELHYLYHSVIQLVDPEKYNQFVGESSAFLDYEGERDLAGAFINMDSTPLNLPDMGPTTLEFISEVPAPYREIANEAKFVKQALDMRAES